MQVDARAAPAASTSASLTLQRVAAVRPARRRKVRSTLPRATFGATRSRNAGFQRAQFFGQAHADSSRKRWLTARSSQLSVPQWLARSPEAKAVMLRIMRADHASASQAGKAGREW